MKKVNIKKQVECMEKYRVLLWETARIFYEEDNSTGHADEHPDRFPPFRYSSATEIKNFFSIVYEKYKGTLQKRWIKIANKFIKEMNTNILPILDSFTKEHVYPDFRVYFFEDIVQFSYLDTSVCDGEALSIFANYISYLIYLRGPERCKYVAAALEIVDDKFRKVREKHLHTMTMWDDDLTNRERLRRIETQLFWIKQILKKKEEL